MNSTHASDGEPDAGAHEPRRHKHVRVTTEPVPGSDPSPTPEPARTSGTENDAQLRQDVPPHWG